jgi:CRP-like cAMP-binding protein
MIEYLIRKLEKFAPLSPDERNMLQSLPIKQRNYPRSEIIAPRGSVQTESSIVMAGFACRFKMFSDGARPIVALQVPGDFVDLHTFVLRPIDHSVAALSPAPIEA